MPLMPALGRQEQANVCEFEARLVYNTSSRLARILTQRHPVSKTKILETTLVVRQIGLVTTKNSKAKLSERKLFGLPS